MTSFLKHTVKRLRPAIREDLNAFARFIATRRTLRNGLNSTYRVLTSTQRAWLHGNFAKLFHQGEFQIESGSWKISFLGRSLDLPIAGTQAWLEWDMALSILGHETEIITTYENLLKSPNRPSCFFDVGANYGLQSLLFLVHGIKTVSFEPNPACHEYFKSVCRINSLLPNIEAVALGPMAGWADLCYPERDEWLGTLNAEVISQLELNHALKKIRVPRITLDGYTVETGLKPALIKIDVEGSELDVLQGSVGTLKSHSPLVVFESFRDRDPRGEMFGFFRDNHYVISPLPFDPQIRPDILSEDVFLTSENSNYIALPKKLY